MPAIVRRGKLSPGSGQVVTRGHVSSVDEVAAGVVASTSALEEAVDELESSVTSLERLTPTPVTVGRLELELQAGRRGGRLDVQPEGGFLEAQVGAPVAVTLAPSSRPDEAEGVVVVFVAQVINRRTMRLHWSAAGPAPARVAVTYIIGGES